MKEQLILLRQLQEIDLRTEEIRQLITALPERLKPARNDFDRLRGMLDAERAKIAETESWRKEQEELIRLENEGVRSAKIKLSAAKNAREYAMANREIDSKRRSISSREDEVLKVIDAMETTRTALVSQDAQVSELGVNIRAEEDKIGAQVSELESRALESSVGRGDVAERIETSLLRKYETVQKRRGIALVPIVNGTCGGCHVRIPPQMINEISRCEDVATCPACYRLLYPPEALDAGAPAGTSA